MVVRQNHQCVVNRRGRQVQWGSRFKRGVCQRYFLLYGEDGLREHLSYTEYMGFRQDVGGIKSAGGDACSVVTPSVLKSMLSIIF